MEEQWSLKVIRKYIEGALRVISRLLPKIYATTPEKFEIKVI